jgi:hypothetical protein
VLLFEVASLCFTGRRGAQTCLSLHSHKSETSGVEAPRAPEVRGGECEGSNLAAAALLDALGAGIRLITIKLTR